MTRIGIRTRFLGERQERQERLFFWKSEWTMTQIGIRILTPHAKAQRREG